MNIPNTLNSRIKILIARTYKAEKLFTNVRLGEEGEIKSNSFEQLNNDEINATKSNSPAALVANDIRAKEWQRAHSELRNALNIMVANNSGSKLVEQVVDLKNQFELGLKTFIKDLDARKLEVVHFIERNEFATALKGSIECIKLNARIQAFRVILNELSHLVVYKERLKTGEQDQSASKVLPDNVIPFKRRA